MKTGMKIGALAVAGCALLAGCVSAPEMSEEDKRYAGPWVETAEAYALANDDELRKPSKIGIEEMDMLFDQISGVAVESLNSALNTISTCEAEKSWASYLMWATDEQGAKVVALAQKTGEKQAEAKAECVKQAKFSTFTTAMMQATQDVQKDMAIVVQFQKDKDREDLGADPVARTAKLVAENYPESQAVLFETLAKTQTFTPEGKAQYYKDAFQVKPMSKAERENYLLVLAKRITRLVELQQQFAAVQQKNSDKLSKIAEAAAKAAMLAKFGKAVSDEGIQAQEAMASLKRIGLQLEASLKLSRFEEQALKELDALKAESAANEAGATAAN